MDPIHKEALKKCRTRIVRDLIPDAELWDLLEQYDIFTPMMLEYIAAEKTRSDKNRKLLDDLARRGPEAYGKFLRCLRESKQGDIANDIIEHERLIRRQKDPNYTEPTPATSGTEEGHILFSGAATSQPLRPENRDQNSLRSSGGVIGQETNFAFNQSQLTTGFISNTAGSNPLQTSNIGQNVPLQTPNTTQNTQTEGNDISRDEEMMLLDEDAPDGIQSPPGPSGDAPFTPSASQRSSAGFVSQPSQPQSFYDEQYSRDSENVYKMDTMPRGYALIINNKDFQLMNCRLGTDVDCQKLQDLFQYLGFEVIVKHNLTGYNMILAMNDFAHEQNLRNVDSIAVAILSHGHKNETIYGVDSVYIKSLDVFNIFSSQNCPAMYNKPKMVIINACRGEDEDLGTSLLNNESDTVSLDVTSIGFTEDPQFRNVNQPTNANIPDLRALNQQRNDGIPNMQDFLIAYSTFPGHVSIRNTEHGSWFIQSLCDVFKNDSHKHSVMDMMTKVNRKVASFQDDESLWRQIPAPSTSMIKRWLLNPPLYQSN